jgi:energy-coupling factor transporter ATP-binding protein EcfA2
MMKLRRFRVTNFRSVDDSGWIDTDDVTALIGTNESGKTNILLPLWKLNPAKEGGITPTSDYPRKRYNEFRLAKPKPTFIEAEFDVGDDLADKLATTTHLPANTVRRVVVSRSFDTQHEVDFPDAVPKRQAPRDELVEQLSSAAKTLDGIAPMKSEEDLKALLTTTVSTAITALPPDGPLDETQLKRTLAILDGVKTDGAPKTSEIVPRYRELCEHIQGMVEDVSRPHPRDIDAAVDLVKKNLPKFVYYSTYGNLDSEIYLPHVIANMARNDLGLKEQSKVRTLKVLFEFVKLQPQEILELGRDFREGSRTPSEAEIATINEKKKQRSILLQSASTLLTTEFRSWWQQGEYRFRFEADGDHFRIWVSDDKRPEEIELEGRSTGLQWFLSFYLVFLVERSDAHEGAILLLDEPGLSLHPLAQRNLSAFFDKLSKDNQLLYTCHSPFLVDADSLDRVRKVYVDADGTSKVTADLKAPDGDARQRGAAYAVYAALGLSVAESLLLGCTPVIVEGPSDQHYLAAIKNVLIAAGKLRPGRELVFPPAGGAKGVRAIASILGARDETLPVVLFDGDQQGRDYAKALVTGLYAAQKDSVHSVDEFTRVADSEIEDLFPVDYIADQVDRLYRSADVTFKETVKEGSPIVPQIEQWAQSHGIALQTPGWKVELAKRIKQYLLTLPPTAIPEDTMKRWTELFTTLQA